ncbi:MAG: hypothetical protein KA004_12200 [Verrucomicrobiales bacterium]|nr:hypothetical protein [Verrucomicrobiales bacterium]
MNILNDLKAHLGNPKFLHVLLEWGVFWGLALSWLFFLLARFVLHDRRALIFSLVLLALSALLVVPVEHYRKKAAPIGSASSRALNEQTRRRADHAWAFYAMAAVAGAAILLSGADNSNAGKVLTTLVVVGGLCCAAVALWLQLREAQVIYDFR